MCKTGSGSHILHGTILKVTIKKFEQNSQSNKNRQQDERCFQAIEQESLYANHGNVAEKLASHSSKSFISA